MNRLVKYSNEFKSLNDKEKLQFIFKLLIRQKNVYEYIAKDKAWNATKNINSIFERLYKCIMSDEKIEENILEEIEEINPENIGWDDKEEDIMGYIITFINNIEAFIREVIQKSNIDIYFAQCNYDYLEAFIYEYRDWKGDNTNLLLEDEMMKQEIERGIRDLHAIVCKEKINYGELCNSKELLIDSQILDKYI